MLLYLGIPLVRGSASIAALTRSLTATQVALYRSILEIGAARGAFALNDDALTIAANLVALEDAYGMYVMNGNADRLPAYIGRVVAFASTATSCDLAPLVETMRLEAVPSDGSGPPTVATVAAPAGRAGMSLS
jgi:hypothetical protein